MDPLGLGTALSGVRAFAMNPMSQVTRLVIGFGGESEPDASNADHAKGQSRSRGRGDRSQVSEVLSSLGQGRGLDSKAYRASM